VVSLLASPSILRTHFSTFPCTLHIPPLDESITISTHINWMGNECGIKTHSKSITVVNLITRNNQPHASGCFLDAKPDFSSKRTPTRKHTTVCNSVLHDSGFYSFKYSIELRYKVNTQYGWVGTVQGTAKCNMDGSLNCGTIGIQHWMEARGNAFSKVTQPKKQTITPAEGNESILRYVWTTLGSN
jgi:hypothetical protein